MRILHVTGDSKWSGGGVIIESLVRMARECGWKVDMLTTDPRFQAAISKLGAEVIDLDVIWRDIRPLRDLLGLLRLLRHLRAHPYDVVHTHTSKAGFVGRIAARLAGVPVVIHTVHGFAFHEQSSWKLVAFYGLLETIAAWFCDAIVTVSHYHRDWALRLHVSSNQKLRAIPNGIDEARLYSHATAPDFRRRIGTSQGCLTIVTHGRLAEDKGLEYLLAALPRLKSRLECEFKLVLVGDGPHRGELETLASRLGISDSVVFDGFQSDIGSILAGADLVVLPTLKEGLSISLLEAMAAGRAIVATDIGSNLEATDQGKCALMVPIRDADALAAAIEHLSNNPESAHILGQAARSRFLATFSESRMLDAYKRLYKDLLLSKGVWRVPMEEPPLAHAAEAQQQ
jgi:glycosyltransferase involved in cell wall biosynthesis